MEATQHRARVRVRVRRGGWRRIRRPVLFLAGALLVVAIVAVLALVVRQGQGLARVDRAEITEEDVLAEARARNVAASVAGPALLDAIVGRELLVQEARRRGLDRRRDYPSDRKRAIELQLASTLLAATPPPPPPPPVRIAAYITQHPAEFAERRRFVVEGLSFAAAADPVSSGSTWDDLQRKLLAAHIPHRLDAYVYSSADAPPQLRDALPRTAVGGLISVSGSGQVDVYRLISNDLAPLEGEAATVEARTRLQHAEREQQVARLLEALRQTHVVRKGHTSWARSPPAKQSPGELR